MGMESDSSTRTLILENVIIGPKMIALVESHFPKLASFWATVEIVMPRRITDGVGSLRVRMDLNHPISTKITLVTIEFNHMTSLAQFDKSTVLRYKTLKDNEVSFKVWGAIPVDNDEESEVQMNGLLLGYWRPGAADFVKVSGCKIYVELYRNLQPV